MQETEALKVTFHLEGDLKGYYTLYLPGKSEPIMKSKTKSKLLKSLYKYYLSQGE